MPSKKFPSGQAIPHAIAPRKLAQGRIGNGLPDWLRLSRQDGVEKPRFARDIPAVNRPYQVSDHTHAGWSAAQSTIFIA